MNKYYVYEWIRLDTNEPFYVGKGKGGRWKELTRGNNKHFNSIVKSIPVVVNILHDNLDEETAYGLECYYIWQYRDIIGYDLVNINNGGEGNSGLVHSEESKRKMSEARIGEKNHFFGKHHSEETLKKLSELNKGRNSWENMSDEGRNERARKISEANKGRKISDEWKKNMSKNHANVKGKNNPRAKSVMCLTTKRIFLTAKDASEYYNCQRQNISKCCHNKEKSCGKYKGEPLKWRYVKWNHNKKFRINK